MSDLSTSLSALRDGAAVHSPAQRFLVRAAGPDLLPWLERLCSNPMQDIQPGECRRATLMDGKGKLRCDLRVLAPARDDDAPVDEVLLDLPDGRYRFTDLVDDDGQQAVDLPIVADVTIKGDACTVDLSDSADQTPGPVNCTLNMAKSGVYCALLSLGEGTVMANSGAYRAIDVISRPGTITHCRMPAPVANRMATGHRIVTAVLGALAQAAPDRVPAAYYGVSYVMTLMAPDPLIPNESRVYFEVEVGGRGGHPETDGADGFSCGFHNLSNSPLEMCETLFPITFTEYGFIPGSGGDGQHRGGLGLAREWRLNADWGTVSGNFERFRHGPYGLAGGAPGGRGRFVHISDGEPQDLPSKVSNIRLSRGDRIRLETSGGGGWGPPEKRTPEARARDRALGFVAPGPSGQDTQSDA